VDFPWQTVSHNQMVMVGFDQQELACGGVDQQELAQIGISDSTYIKQPFCRFQPPC